jgi:hypothetical protein
MRERAAVVGGSLVAGPSETGWLVRLTVPATVRDPAAEPAKAADR